MKDTGNMVVLIIDGGAVSGHLVAMRSLIADIATMRQRMPWMLIQTQVMTFLVMRCSRLSVQYVALNKMSSKYVSTVECVWANTSVRSASSMMMISQNSNTTVMVVAFVELGDEIISSTATNVVAAIQLH